MAAHLPGSWQLDPEYVDVSSQAGSAGIAARRQVVDD
jgi:hypothetical protein